MAETATETTQAADTAAEVSTRFPLPDGKVTPIQLKNKLVQLGLAPKAIKPQVFYTFVNNPGKTDPFPVKHYAEDGTEHVQKGGPDGNVNTRPGLDLDEGVEWYKRRQARIAEKAAGTQTNADGNTTPTPAGGNVEAAKAQAEEPQGDDENFTEAE